MEPRADYAARISGRAKTETVIAIVYGSFVALVALALAYVALHFIVKFW